MKFRYAILLMSAMALPSCTPLGIATGAGAAVGVAAAQEGGLNAAVSDVKIRAQINDLWFRSNVDSFLKLDLTVNQGRVLVTGIVQDPEERVEAIRLAWQPAGVKQVINEVQVANSAGIGGFARDTWITTRLRTALTLDRDVQSINYSIDTVSGIVYLIGVARNQSELNRVIETARTIPNVKRVVSYVKLAGRDISDGYTGGNAVQPAQESVNNYEPVPSYDQSGYNQQDYNQPVESYEPAPLNDTDMSGYSDYNDPVNYDDTTDYSNSVDTAPSPGGYSATGGPQSLIEVEPLD